MLLRWSWMRLIDPKRAKTVEMPVKFSKNIIFVVQMLPSLAVHLSLSQPKQWYNRKQFWKSEMFLSFRTATSATQNEWKNVRILDIETCFSHSINLSFQPLQAGFLADPPKSAWCRQRLQVFDKALPILKNPSLKDFESKWSSFAIPFKIH